VPQNREDWYQEKGRQSQSLAALLVFEENRLL
jgi:hypothetical protein